MSIIKIILIAYLIYLSYLDIRYREVSNWLIGVLLVVGILYHIFKGDILVAGLGLVLMTIFSLTLYYNHLWGGADAKLMCVLALFVPFIGLPNMLALNLYFICVLGIIVTVYSLLWKLIERYSFKRFNNELPLIPAIALSFLVNWLFQFH